MENTNLLRAIFINFCVSQFKKLTNSHQDIIYQGLGSEGGQLISAETLFGTLLRDPLEAKSEKLLDFVNQSLMSVGIASVDNIVLAEKDYPATRDAITEYFSTKMSNTGGILRIEPIHLRAF